VAIDVLRQRAGLKVSYGLLDDTVIDLMVPYQSIEIAEIGLRKTGLADVELGVNQRLASDGPQVWLGAAAALPTGDHDAADSTGERAHASLQLGRGAPDLMFSFKLLNSLSQRWVLYGDTTARWNLGQNDLDYHHGTVIDTTAGASFAVGKFDIFGHFLWEHAEPDTRTGRGVPDTGGAVLYATPGVRYWLFDECAITLRNRFLAWADVNGEQMLPRQTVGLGITAMFGP